MKGNDRILSGRYKYLDSKPINTTKAILYNVDHSLYINIVSLYIVVSRLYNI